jgi:hypothetical protein
VAEADEGGAGGIEALAGADPVPPVRAATVDRAEPGHGDALFAVGEDAGLMDPCGGALPGGIDDGVEGRIRHELEPGAALQMELDERAQAQSTRAVNAGGDRDDASSGLGRAVDGRLDIGGFEVVAHALHLCSSLNRC